MPTREELSNPASPVYQQNPYWMRPGESTQAYNQRVSALQTSGIQLPEQPALSGVPSVKLAPEVQKAQELITTSRPAIDRTELERKTKAEALPQRQSLEQRLQQRITEAQGISGEERRALEGQLGTRRRFSTSAQAFISFIDEKNKKAIANLEIQKEEALSNFDFQLAQLVDKRINDERAAQQQELDNAFKIVDFAQKQADAETKRKEPLIKSQQDAAIVQLYDSGETNPLKIFSNLKSLKDEEGNVLLPKITFQNVADITDKLAGEKFQGIVGEWKDAIRAGAITAETNLFDYINQKDPSKTLELKKLGLDIKKLERDLTGLPGDSLVGTPQGNAISDSIRTLKFPSVADRKDAQVFIQQLIATGRIEDAKEALISYVSNSSPAEEQKILAGKDDAVVALRRIQDRLADYEAAGGKTNLFTGLSEKALEKGGLTRDPKLAELANDIGLAIIDYRRAVSGAAFTESEGKAYDKIYPSEGNTKELNEAKIRSLITKFEEDKESYLKRKIGERKYNQIFEEEEKISAEEDKSLSDDEAFELFQRSTR